MKYMVALFAAITILSGMRANAANIIILDDDFPYSSRKFATELEKGIAPNFNTKVVDGISLVPTLNSEAGKGSVLVMANGRCFPADAKCALISFLKRGNHLLALSGPAFENLLFRANGKWLTVDMIKSEIAKSDGRQIIDFAKEDMSKWTRISASMQNPTEFKVEPSNDSNLPDALHVNISKLDDWDIIASPPIDAPFHDGEAAMLLWAKGSPGTSQLKVQWTEEDGTRWIATIKLTNEWRRYALLLSDFKFWPDGAAPGRGVPGDRLDPSKASKLSFIMERDASNPDRGKPRSYWVADIRVVSDPTANSDPTDISFETLYPEYRVFRTTPAEVKVLNTSQVFDVNEEIISPISRAPGYGADALRKWRFMPIGKAYDADGEYRGTCAHLMLNTLGEYKGSIWGAVGFSQEYLEQHSNDCIKLIRYMIGRMINGIFMANGGSEHFGYVYGEKARFGAYILNLADSDKTSTLMINLYSGSHLVDTFSLKGNLPASNIDSPIHLMSDELALKPGEYRVDVSLVVDGSTVDGISHTFNVIEYKPIKAKDTVQIKNGDFYLEGKKWYPLGINYWPRSSAGLESKDMYEIHWLAPEQYDPDIIEEDLKVMNDLRINTVSIQYLSLIQSRPLMDFMARAQKHGIMVHLYVEGLHPLRYNMWGFRMDKTFMETGGGLIDAAHLGQTPALFAYDVGWEVIVGKYDKRRLFDKEWNKWVIDRYGSIESACNDWKYRPDVTDGIITGPTDDQLFRDGEWRTFVAAYRRFWDDEISKGYRRVRENIKSLDKHHLIGARSGYGGTGSLNVAPSFPFDLASGAKHLDFSSPEAYVLSGDYHSFLKGGFNNAYARHFSDNKPVFWPEFGLPVIIGIQPLEYKHRRTPEQLNAQKQFYENMIRLTMDTNGNGLTGWWWPGGFRLYENSDFGIIDPDGKPRPSALVMKQMADRFYSPRDIKVLDYFLTVDRDKYVTGYAGMYMDFADKYVEAFESGHMPGVKTMGTGTTSINAPLLAVGNTPYNGKNPPKYLNGEFNWLSINGRVVKDGDAIDVKKRSVIRVQAFLGNTAEAKWIASKAITNGCVYLSANIGETETLMPIDRDTPFLKNAFVSGSFIVPDVGKSTVDCSFNMVAKGRMRFGEVAYITLNLQ